MPDTALHSALQDATRDVLEKMFFIEPSAAAPEPCDLAIRLTFEGDPSGSFQLGLANSAAAAIAANFLGDDPESLTSPQLEEVAKELANMICGAVLSRIESRATFRLGTPHILPSEAAPAGGCLCAFDTGAGVLSAAICMDVNACPSTAKSAF